MDARKRQRTLLEKVLHILNTLHSVFLDSNIIFVEQAPRMCYVFLGGEFALNLFKERLVFMSNVACFLGIDCGLSTAKVSLYDYQGPEISTVSASPSVLHPAPGHVECDLEANWTVIAGLIRQLLDAAHIPPEHVLSVCCTGHGNGLYVLDRNGRPLQPGITSLDARSTAILHKWQEENLVSRTRPINGQGLWNGQTLPLMRWQLEERPETLEKVHTLLCSKDYVKFKLTGEINSDYSEMSKVGLLDIKQRRYSQELLALLGIENFLPALPPLFESGSICGRIHQDAASETGLRKGTPVISGLADIDACALGAGVIHSDEMCIITGTWSINEALTDHYVESEDLFGISLYPVTGLYLLLEASATSAANLAWFIDNLLPQAREKCEKEGLSIYEFCDRMVQSSPAGSDSLVFHPFVYGSHQKSEASAAFLGIKGWTSQAQIIRAVYEGIAFAHRVHVDRLRGAGARAQAARLTGGLAKSDVWAQMAANILNLGLELTTDKELGTKGCMICGAVGCGLYQNINEAVEHAVTIAKTFEPQESVRKYYDDKYARFKATLEKAEPLWEILANSDG